MGRVSLWGLSYIMVGSSYLLMGGLYTCWVVPYSLWLSLLLKVESFPVSRDISKLGRVLYHKSIVHCLSIFFSANGLYRLIILCSQIYISFLVLIVASFAGFSLY